MERQTQLLNPAIQAAPLFQQSYTPDGLLGGVTDANNNLTGFAYDGFDRLATTTYADATTQLLGYDADGNVTSRTTRAQQTITFTNDTLNRLTGKAAPSEPTVSYGYDLAGRMTSAGDDSAALATPSGAAASFTATYNYDALNRPTNITWNQAPAQTTPDAASVVFTHHYNAANQRIGQSASDSSWLSYPAATAGTVGYSVNALNQYTKVGSASPAYDGNGNLTGDGTFTYGYDAENRLITLGQGGTAVASYAYDAQGRRKTKSVGSATTVTVTDAGNREVLEYDGGSGQVQRWYAFGLGTDQVLSQMNVAAGSRQTMIPDIQGSISATLDSGGSLTKAAYQPYGESSSTAGTFPYTGRRIDPESNGLYYYRAGMYNPAIGRFMQTDPIGFSGGVNLYAYVHNDPLNRVDPLGLCDNPQSCQGGTGSTLLAAGTGTVLTTPNGVSYGDKIQNQTGPRGFTAEQIDEAVSSGQRIDAINMATGGPATRYINLTTQQSVVIDNTTNEVIQVGGPGFLSLEHKAGTYLELLQGRLRSRWRLLLL